jgi:hypothetical protein
MRRRRDSGTTNQDEAILLRNGPSGTGTTIWQYSSEVAPGTTGAQNPCDPNIVGSANTAIDAWVDQLFLYDFDRGSLVGYNAQ